jgi:hypothetical protein
MLADSEGKKKKRASHDALASMAQSRLSHSAGGKGVDTRSLFERSMAAAAAPPPPPPPPARDSFYSRGERERARERESPEYSDELRKSILPALPESATESLTEASDSEAASTQPEDAEKTEGDEEDKDEEEEERESRVAAAPPAIALGLSRN